MGDWKFLSIFTLRWIFKGIPTLSVLRNVELPDETDQGIVSVAEVVVLDLSAVGVDEGAAEDGGGDEDHQHRDNLPAPRGPAPPTDLLLLHLLLPHPLLPLWAFKSSLHQPSETIPSTK